MALPAETNEERTLEEVKEKKKQQRPIDEIESRKTPELVVAICGAVGAGVSTVAQEISEQLNNFSYTVSIVKVSNLIFKKRPVSQSQTKHERIKYLQDCGNELREKYGNDYLALLAIAKINDERFEFARKNSKESIQNYGSDVRKARRHVTIIDSLKHPAEVELLQKVYGKMFVLFGVLCNDGQRKTRLLSEGKMDPIQAEDLMERDKKEKIKHGQQLLKTLQHSDFFIRNSRRNTTSLERPIKRFVSLLIGENTITPTIDEFGMYIAESVSRRSGCISRQVGAAILTESGDIVSTGRNDVPKAFGGLYGEEDGDDDDRCIRQFDGACSSEKFKSRIFDRIQSIFKDILKDDCFEELIAKAIDTLEDESEIKDLLEYSRAVHAEMDAITSAARNGNISLRNTILYSTTFPCHHCARHIVASGIKTVYYIEPYEKSLATKLHPDSILLDSQNQSDKKPKVIFKHFEGVAPKRYLDLFSCNNRKEKGTLKRIDLRKQRPTAASQLDTFLEYETRVVKFIKNMETQGINTTEEGDGS